jgi:hypothetical protein
MEDQMIDTRFDKVLLDEVQCFAVQRLERSIELLDADQAATEEAPEDDGGPTPPEGEPQ